MSQTGFFTPSHKVYTITDMFPKRPWNNLLWNERYIAILNQFGFGPSWHRLGKICSGACSDGESRIVFVRDNQDGSFWAANRNFAREEFEEFYTEVGQGFSRIVSCHKGIRCIFTIFVPTEGNFECWKVDIENASGKDRDLSIFVYSNSQLNSYPHDAYNNGNFDAQLNGVILCHRAFNDERDLLYHFLASDVSVEAYETTNRRFKGVYSPIGQPDAVKNGQLASIDTSFDAEMILALQFNTDLKRGSKNSFNFLTGLAASREEAIAIVKQSLSEVEFQNQLKKIQTYTDALIDKVCIRTPDEDINGMVNVWLKRQIDLGKTWARIGCRGFRDIMQDATAFMMIDNKTAAEKILYCLPHQWANGNTLRLCESDIRRPFVDGPVWIIPAVTGYIKESGDFGFLEKDIPYFESDESGTILDHCHRGMRFLFDNLGQHGLCLWGGGDWNDSLNAAGLLGKGESVWLTQATIVSARDFAKLLEVIGEEEKAKGVSEKADALVANLRKYAWDKDHFICGYTDWDEKVGSYENDEGKIFLNMQTWGVLSDSAEDPKGLMDVVERELVCPYGYVLNKPSYTKGDDHIGRVTYFEKGAYENGSVYNHGVAFKIAADCKLGRSEQAYETVKKMLSTNPGNPSQKSGVEPYAVTNMYLGPENKLRAGESLSGWFTGTAGWLFRCVVEYMLGVQADYEGLKITPCLPGVWKDVSIRREYRGATYNISIKNTGEPASSKRSIVLDGNLYPSNVLPIFEDGKEHSVEVTI